MKKLRLMLHNFFSWHDHKLYKVEDFVYSFDFKYKCECGHRLWITEITYVPNRLFFLRSIVNQFEMEKMKAKRKEAKP